MQFIVPQFIDIEDKVIGPLTFKQFMYLAGSAGLAYAVFKLVPNLISIPLALGIASLGVSLAFLKVNGKSFVFTMQAFISFVFQSKLYIWKQQIKKEETPKQKEEPKQDNQEIKLPRLTETKLGDLSWSLDILDMKQKEE